MKKIKLTRTVSLILGLIFCVMFILSVIDTKDTVKNTNFSQDNIKRHIEKFTENGPRSLFHTEANDKALEHIANELESYGVKEGDTTDFPAYQIQEYVAEDSELEHQNFYLKNLIVHIPANSQTPSGKAIMFMGHFDSVPMGNGATDDSVACATMLEAVRYYQEKKAQGFTLSNDLVFCFVNGEEFDLFGSRAFMEEFKGFDNITERIRFGVNLESRGTDGTLIMFETAKNNYNTVKLFSEINKSIFTCSIATMVYDTMPNSTDFSSFKESYQGLNMANIGGGEDYHTQNDKAENVGEVYLSQQAQIVEAIIEKLSDYDLEKLYNSNESAVFFSYLNLTTAVYNHTTVIILAAIAIALIVLNILLCVFYRKEKNLKSTAKAFLAIISALILSAGLTFGFYYLFQLIAALFGTIDIHTLGTITYSNIPIVMGIGLTVLGIIVLTNHFSCKWLKIERRDLIRAFSYLHAVLGITLSFLLPDASYLFIMSGIMFMINELLITAIRKSDFSEYHGELLCTALYLPISIPVVFLATTALGMTMAYVYGLVFALIIFAFGVCITPLCERFSVRSLVRALRKKDSKVSPVEGALHLILLAMVILLAVTLVKPNASVNLQGKQNIAKLPYDDALVYIHKSSGENEYRIQDLNAYSALKKYCPDMKYNSEFDYYYRSWGVPEKTDLTVLSSAEGKTLTIEKNTPDSLVYLEFIDFEGEGFTVDDGITKRDYRFDEMETPVFTLHSEATVTFSGDSTKVSLTEVLRDYAPLIPEEFENDNEMLHFNLWLNEEFTLK